ncbi:CPBP family intramembrane glutamic endopeptidase [Fredinandcohnia humi]
MMTVFLIIWIAASIGAIAILPYQMKMLRGKIEEDSKNNPGKKIPPPTVMMLISAIQSIVLLGVATYVGTLLAPKVKLHWWLLDNLLHGTEIPYSLSGMILGSIGVGLVAAIIILSLDSMFSKKIPKFEFEEPSKGQALLASLYGGISEEVLTRLFLMTLFVYLSTLIGLGDISYWIGILLAAVLFGVGHLPTAFSLIGKTKMVVIRTIFLNTIPGIFFGYLYWKYGIEIAMIAHFSADIFLHVILGPIVRKRMK